MSQPGGHSGQDDFKKRLARYEENLQKGRSFQADGTLGGVPVHKPRRVRHGAILSSILAVVVAVMLLKIGGFYMAGKDTYRLRLAGLTEKMGAFGSIIAFVMQPDPVTVQAALIVAMVHHRVQETIGKASQ